MFLDVGIDVLGNCHRHFPLFGKILLFFLNFIAPLKLLKLFCLFSDVLGRP